MSWENTYSHTLVIAFDRACAAVVFNEPDITVSSLCWVVRAGSPEAIAQLKLYGWQHRLLIGIGDFLERFWPGHCASAHEGDVEATSRIRRLLNVSTAT